MADNPHETIAGIVAAAEPIRGVEVRRTDREESESDPLPPPDMGNPISTSPQGGGGDTLPDRDSLDRELAFYPLTDLGNAERFVARHGQRFRWVSALGWLAWDGRRWSREDGEAAMQRAEHETARAIQDEAKAIKGTNLDQQLGVKNKMPWFLSDAVRTWGRQSEGAGHLKAIGARAAPILSTDPNDLDTDPFKINCNNGTLSVSKSQDETQDYVRFADHDPDALITKLAPVDYDPDAACPAFERFLAYVQPVPAMRRFLQQWLGLSLTGATEQKLAFFWGKGRNGKSTLMDVVAAVAGDYGETVPIETFLSEGRGRGAGQATPDLAILPGVRFLRTSEPDRGAKLAESLIKLVTGGEPIQARHLNRDYFRFTPQFKLTMSGNYRPEIRGNDEGIWRRVLLVPWTVTVPVEDVDRELPAKLAAEASGILNWLLDGLRDWLDNGLITPGDVVDATAEYRQESDPLGRFLTACTASAQGERVQSSELHRLFLAWAKANGEREWSATGFGRAMREAGYKSKNSNVNYWLDIRTITTALELETQAGPPGPAAPPPGGVVS